MLYIDDEDNEESARSGADRQVNQGEGAGGGQNEDDEAQEEVIHLKTYKFKTPQFIVRYIDKS